MGDVFPDVLKLMGIRKSYKSEVSINVKSFLSLFFWGPGGNLEAIQGYSLWDKAQLTKEAECLTVDMRSNGNPPERVHCRNDLFKGEEGGSNQQFLAVSYRFIPFVDDEFLPLK